MVKCVYNGLKVGHNLVKKKKKKQTQIKFGDWNNNWGRHTQREDKSSFAKPLCLSTLPQCKDTAPSTRLPVALEIGTAT